MVAWQECSFTAFPESVEGTYLSSQVWADMNKHRCFCANVGIRPNLTVLTTIVQQPGGGAPLLTPQHALHPPWLLCTNRNPQQLLQLNNQHCDLQGY